MIELNLLDSVWCGDDEKEKKKKGKANKKQKKNKQSEWTEHNTSKRKEVEGPVVECSALRWSLFVFFLAQEKGDKDGTVEKRKQFIVVWHTLPMMLCSSARAGTTGLLDASVPCANGGFCGRYFRKR